MTSRRC